MAPPIRAPIPVTKKLRSESFAFSPRQSSPLAVSAEIGADSGAPRPTSSVAPAEDHEFGTLESNRLAHYRLNLPSSDADALQLLRSENGPYFAGDQRPSPFLEKHLPYKLETLQDKARYLSHIVTHLYIAVKSLDLAGAVSISAKDLEAVRGSLGDGAVSIEQIEDAERTFYDDDVSDEGSQDSDADSDEDIDTGTSTPASKMGSASAAIINARNWSIELKTLVHMDFPIPVALRASLVKVYYAICLSEGQGMLSEIFLDVLQKLAEEKDDLKAYGLTLDWELAYAQCLKSFPHEDAAFDNYDKNHFRMLLSVCFVCNTFFDQSSVPIIVKKVLSKFSSANSSLAISCLYGLLPMNLEKAVGEKDGKPIYSHADVRHYIPTLFYVWSSSQCSESLDLHFVALLSRIAEYSLIEAAKDGNSNSAPFGPFGIFDETQFVSLFQTLQSSLNIGSLKQSKHPSSFFQTFSNLVVFSIMGDQTGSSQCTLDTLASFFNAVRSFVHPSNSGPWSPLLSKLIQSIVSQYHKRLRLERDDVVNNEVPATLKDLREDYKLNDTTHRKLAKILLPLIQTGIQGKKDSTVNQYVTSMSLLCQVVPEMVLDAVLIDCYSSLEFVTSNHRLKAVLKELAAVIRYMAELPVYRVHVVRILTSVLPGIDSNDLVKTIQTLHLITVTSTFVPFHDLSEGKIASPDAAAQFTAQHIAFLEESFRAGDQGPDQLQFEFDAEFEKEAFLSSTVSFKQFLMTYCERIFLMLENLPDPKKSTGYESRIVQFLPGAFYVLVESLSDDCFEYLADHIYGFVSEKILYTLADCVGNIVSALVKRNPSSQFPKFFDYLEAKVNEEISENGAGSARGGDEVLPRDQPLLWYTVLLSSVIAQAGEFVLLYQDRVEIVASRLLQNVKGPVSMVTSLITYQLLNTMTTTRLREARFLPPNVKGATEEAWGGYQFSERRFDDSYLSFKWHSPSKAEIEVAVGFFTKTTDTLMTQIRAAISGYEADAQVAADDLAFTDTLNCQLLTLGHAVAGVSALFDPGFKEGASDASKPQILKHKLDSLAFFKKKLGSAESFSKGSPMSKSPDFIGSPSKTSLETEAESDVDMQEAEKEDIVHEDFVEAHDIDEDVIIEDDTMNVAEIPFSSKASPSPSRSGKNDVSESLNAVLSFRNRKIYASNYAFGDTKDEKDSFTEYAEVHEQRDKVGRFLHSIFKFLIEKQANNTKLLKVLLHIYKIWLCDVGSESVLNLNRAATLRFDYLDTFQFVRRIRKPYTRIAFGLLLEKKHKERVRLFAGSRLLTSVDKLLLSDVVELSTSAYSSVSASAISALNASMKLLLGSYTPAIKQLINILQKAIVANDDQVVRHSLAVLKSKRFKNKIATDFHNLPAIVEILNRCMSLGSNSLVNASASGVFSHVVNKIKVPSSVCDIREEYVDSLRPPDGYADIEVKAVKAAKQNKRAVYLRHLKSLSDSLLESLSPSKFWKINYFNLSLLMNIQVDFEVEVHDQVLAKLLEFTKDTHPQLFRLALKGLCGVLEKFRTLSTFDYDLLSCYVADHHPAAHRLIDTKPASSAQGNFKYSFREEMKNFDNPSFFIDNKSNECWLFWDDQLDAVDPQLRPEMTLRETDRAVVGQFGAMINRDFVSNTLKLLVREAESDGGFHTNDVKLVALLVHLSAAGLTPNFSNDEWSGVIKEIYKADDKDSHLVTCEVFAGLLVAKSHVSAEFAVERDRFVAEMLETIINKDISPETRGIWIVFAWWVPSNADLRRFPRVAAVLTDFNVNKASDSPFIASSKLMILKHLVATMSYRYPGTDVLITDSFEVLDHPYQAVREQIASLLTALFMVSPIDPYPDSESFICAVGESAGDVQYFQLDAPFADKLSALFEYLRSERTSLHGLTAQEILKTPYFYRARSVLKLLRNVVVTSAATELVPYLCQDIIPFLLELAEFREACMLADVGPQQTLVVLANIPFRRSQLATVVDFLVAFDFKSTAWHNVYALGLFTQFFHAKQLLALSEEQRDAIFEIFFKLIFHEQAEVREMAEKGITTLIHTWHGAALDRRITATYDRLVKILNRNKKKLGKSSSDEVLTKLHGATLGLGALVKAFPYISPIPRWIPLVLTTLANRCSNLPGNIGKTAKSSLSNFKKNRQDTWHIDVNFFAPEELQDLEGALWTSYFV